MTDNYEPRLRAELKKLANAVPMAPEVGHAETGRAMHGRTRVRSALPVGSLLAAGLIALAIIVIAPRIAPADTATPSTSVSTQTPSLPAPSPSPSATERPRAANPFTATGSLIHAQMYADATLLNDGTVLVTGGADISISSTNVSSWAPCAAELYDPATGTFRATGSMITTRVGATATLLLDGRVLVTGGIHERGKPLSSTELYDPKTGTFSTSGSMASPRAGHTATLLEDGRVLVVGGRADSSGTAAPASAELYDPTTGTFTSVGKVVAARERHTATLLADGRVLIAGGIIPPASTPDSTVPVAAAELYDPASGTFSPTGSMLVLPNVPFQGAAALLADGRVLLVGGQAEFQAELYDPKSGAFSSSGPSMSTGLLATVTPLPSGLVLIASGWDTHTGSTAAAELYDPRTDTYRSAGSMATPRFGAPAALLPDGRVLILGGRSVSPYGQDVVLDSAELYDPTGGSTP